MKLLTNLDLYNIIYLGCNFKFLHEGETMEFQVGRLVLFKADLTDNDLGWHYVLKSPEVMCMGRVSSIRGGWYTDADEFPPEGGDLTLTVEVIYPYAFKGMEVDVCPVAPDEDQADQCVFLLTTNQVPEIIRRMEKEIDGLQKTIQSLKRACATATAS